MKLNLLIFFVYILNFRSRFVYILSFGSYFPSLRLLKIYYLVILLDYSPAVWPSLFMESFPTIFQSGVYLSADFTKEVIHVQFSSCCLLVISLKGEKFWLYVFRFKLKVLFKKILLYPMYFFKSSQILCRMWILMHKHNYFDIQLVLGFCLLACLFYSTQLPFTKIYVDFLKLSWEKVLLGLSCTRIIYNFTHKLFIQHQELERPPQKS